MDKKYYLLLERKLLDWVRVNRVEIIFYFIFSIFIILASFVPYLNLYINNQFIVFLIISGAIVIFRLTIEKVSLVLISLFVICIPLVIVKDYDRAEILINLVFGLFFIVLLSNIWRIKEK